MAPTDWQHLLDQEASKPYWQNLQQFVSDERRAGTIYPSEDDVLSALSLTPLQSVRAVILGQDPYHGPGQAHGLCFSVRPPHPIPPSLRNIHKELVSDLGVAAPDHGSLVSWAKNGVLLINTVMTVRDGEANSHCKRGWEQFSDAIIDAVNSTGNRVVFILWGAAAQKKRDRLNLDLHRVIAAPHPSPLSASRGFFGSRPFSSTNDLLIEAGSEAIDWRL